MMDWHDLARTDRVVVEQLNPTNLDATMGELDGVDLSGSSLSWGYYVDTRVTGQLRVVGEGWRRGTMLRVTHRVDEWGWSRELGTFIVTNDSATREGGAWAYDLELQSVLYGLSTDLLVRPWAIAANAKALTAARQIVEAAGRQLVTDGANDYALKGAKVIESGTSRLSALFALADMANDRLDVDGHGRVTLERYVPPASKVPTLAIDLTDPRGVAMDGVTRSTDWLAMPNVAAVRYRYDKGGRQYEINASATIDATSPLSSTARGYTVTDFRDLMAMSPATAARAQQLARQYLAADSAEHVEWQLSTTYLPVTAGDVVELVVHDGEDAYRGSRHCLVKTVELDLGTMTMALTLKETAAGEEEA